MSDLIGPLATLQGDALKPPTFGDGAYVHDTERLKRLFGPFPLHRGKGLSSLSGMPIVTSRMVPENKMFVVQGGKIVGVYEFTEGGGG